MTKHITMATVMDPLAGLAFEKDSTLGLLQAAQQKNWQNFVIMRDDLFVNDGVAYCNASRVTVNLDSEDFYQVEPLKEYRLDEFDVIMMRLDPPFDMEYITITWILEWAEKRGVLVVNKPSALRDLNEKFAITQYPNLSPLTFVGSNMQQILDWLELQQSNNVGDCVIKPLDGMGGREIFRLSRADDNCKVIVEAVTRNGSKTVMLQHYLPSIVKGDKRVWIIDGEPFHYMLARIPFGDSRGNLDRGAKGVLQQSTPIEMSIGKGVSSLLKESGVIFAGIDVIGDKLTEINITSPTGLRALSEVGIDGGELVINAIAKYL